MSLREQLLTLYPAYAAGKLDFVLDAFDEKAEFISYAPVEIFPYLGRHHGKAAIKATMQAAHETFEHVSYLPIFIVAEKTDAAAIIVARLRQRATGRMITLMVAHFIRFREGRIVELREFMDSYDAAQQVLGRELFGAQ